MASPIILSSEVCITLIFHPRQAAYNSHNMSPFYSLEVQGTDHTLYKLLP